MSEHAYIDIVEANNWQMFDITTDVARGGWLREHNELAAVGRALETVIGGHYLLAPIPETGQTVGEANYAVQGVGPSLHIHNASSPNYRGLRLNFLPNLAIFSRLAILPEEVCLYGPPLPSGKPSDLVSLHPAAAQEIFAQDFKITPIAELEHLARQYHE